MKKIGYGLTDLGGIEKMLERNEKAEQERQDKLKDLGLLIISHMVQAHDSKYCPLCRLYSKSLDEL